MIISSCPLIEKDNLLYYDYLSFMPFGTILVELLQWKFQRITVCTGNPKKAKFLLNRVNMCPKWEKYFWQLKQIPLTWPKTIQRGRVLVAKPTSCLKKYFSIFTSFHPIILNITIVWWPVLLERMTIWWMRECIQSGVRASLGVSQTSFATNRHTLEPWFFTSAAWT